jgi:hypothetical protein
VDDTSTEGIEKTPSALAASTSRASSSPSHRPSSSVFSVVMLASVMNVTASAPLSSRVAVRGANRARLVRCASPVVVARATTRHRARINLTVRAADAEGAAEETEDDFEARLGALRGKRSKRAVSDVARKEKDFGAPTSSSSASPAGTKKRKGVRDFTTVGDISEPSGKNWGPETILYEGPPARGEIIANVAMSWTVVWIPLTIAAIGRGLWSSYKITDKRVVVISTSPLRCVLSHTGPHTTPSA